MTGNLTTIIKHEWRVLQRDRTIFLVAGVFFVVGTHALVAGFYNAEKRRAPVAAAITREHEKYDELKIKAQAAEKELTEKKQPLDAYEYGARDPDYILSNLSENNVILPPAPHESLDLGQADLYPNIFSVMTLEIGINPYSQAVITPGETTVFGNALEPNTNPLRLLVGNFDLAFLTIYIFPPLIFALNFNLLSAEKEDGTLNLLLAQPVALRRIVIGKIFARAPVFIFFAVLFPLAAMFINTGLRGAADWARGSLWILTTLLYAAFWFGLAILVNAFGFRSLTNALILASLWIALVVAFPAFVSLCAVNFYPVPLRIELVNEMRRARSESREKLNEEKERAAFIKWHPAETKDAAMMFKAMKEIKEAAPVDNEMLNDFFNRHPNLAGDRRFSQLELYKIFLAAQEEYVEAQTQPLRKKMVAQREKQKNLMNIGQTFLPGLAAQNIFRELAGTSESRNENFFNQAIVYQQNQRTFFWSRIFKSAPVQASVYDQLPRFSFREEPASEIARRVLPGMLLLLFTMLLLFAGTAFRLLRHYPLAA